MGTCCRKHTGVFQTGVHACHRCSIGMIWGRACKDIWVHPQLNRNVTATVEPICCPVPEHSALQTIAPVSRHTALGSASCPKFASPLHCLQQAVPVAAMTQPTRPNCPAGDERVWWFTLVQYKRFCLQKKCQAMHGGHDDQWFLTTGVQCRHFLWVSDNDAAQVECCLRGVWSTPIRNIFTLQLYISVCAASWSML